jgi:DNA-directed RNA polymerase subunit beta'
MMLQYFLLTTKLPVKYEVPGTKTLTVADGAAVKKGDRLTNGSLNLHEVMSLRGVEETQSVHYQRNLGMFAQQGVDLADQHLEIIVRQMFSRVQIEDSGDSLFVTGDIVSKASVVEENAKFWLLTVKNQQRLHADAPWYC